MKSLKGTGTMKTLIRFIVEFIVFGIGYRLGHEVFKRRGVQ